MPSDAAPSPSAEYPFANEDFQFFKNQPWSFPVLHNGDTNCAKGFQLAHGLYVRECGRTGMWRLKSIHPTRSLSVGFDKV